MAHLKKSLIETVAASLLLAVATQAAAEQVESKVKEVALFKNGLGFFVSEVICPADARTFGFRPAAAPAHGTFWVAYPNEVKLRSLTAKEVQAEEQAEVLTIAEILKANVGREVRILVDRSEVQGTIMYFAQDRQVEQPRPYEFGSAVGVGARPGQPVQGAVMIIRSEGKDVCVNPQQVKKVEFVQGSAETKLTNKSKTAQLDIDLAEPAGGQKLAVSYLAKGITWAPSYIVDISKPDKATLSAKAAVINETADLEDVTLQLVTGFPNLRFADVVSPLGMKENLAQFLQALIRGESGRGQPGPLANVMSQSIALGDYEGRRRPSMPEYGAAMAGAIAEDLFLYPVKEVSLASGQVGYYPLFTEEVPYKHIYKWDVPDYINEDDRYRYRSYERRGGEPPEEEVWHCIRMENTTIVPWTTAPAETVKNGFVLGQDTLQYTPVKGDNTVRITRAVNVKAEQIELETERKREAVRFYGDSFDLITIEGKLSVTNFENKDIKIEISKTLSGEIQSTQPEPKIKSLARGLWRMNATKKLTWTMELQPGQSEQITYTYQVYVRR